MSDVARNIELVERVERAYNARDYDTVRAGVASDLVAHSQDPKVCRQGWRARSRPTKVRSGPSPTRTPRSSRSRRGRRFVSHVRTTGTHDGELAFASLPPTGKSIDLDWIQISRHADDGIIQESWAQMEPPTMMVQLGVMPALPVCGRG